jgi:serine/threonine protein kinase
MNDLSPIGSHLGKYEIKGEIGRGGMGSVLLGYDPLLDRQVAIKVLAPHLVWETEFVERFLREARAAARLKHPNIVTIHDVGHEGSWYYFVMEYLAGDTLATCLQSRGALPVEEVLAILHPLGAALDYAHYRGVVHRDVKPGNVILGADGMVTLMDFGIARAAQEARMTGTGTIMGTPEYMSPEQARGMGTDARTDQYSLAVVAYQMLSGQVPFQAESTLSLIYKVVHEAPPPLAERRPGLPPAAEAVLDQALAKEPGARYPTVLAFVTALEEALLGHPVVVEAPGTVIAEKEGATAASLTLSPTAQAIAVTQAPAKAQAPAPASRRAISPYVWILGGLAAVVVLAMGGLALALAVAMRGSSTLPASQPGGQPTAAPQAIAVADSPSPSATAQPTPTPVSTPTPPPTDTPVPLPSNTPLPSPTATPLPSPTATPTPAPPPTATAKPATSAPTATQAPAVASGQFTLLKPVAPDNSTQGSTVFEWQWGSPLAGGQGFEVRVWREGEPPKGVHNAVEDNKNGNVMALGNNAYRLTVDISQAAGVQGRSGDYLWAVVLVQVSPEYKDLGIQSPPGHLRFDVGGGGGNGGGDKGGGSKPTY